MQVKAAVCRRLADEVIVAGGVDRAVGDCGAGGGVGGGAGGHNAGNGYVQRLADAEHAEIRPVIERLEHRLRAAVIQTVIAANDVIGTLAGAHGVRHNGGVGRAGKTGVGRGQDQRLAHPNAADGAEVVELDDLVFIRLIAQTPSAVDAADSFAARNDVAGEVVRHAVAGGQRGDSAGRETAAGRAAGDGGAGRGGCGRAVGKCRRRLIADRQTDLRADSNFAEGALAREAVELHDQVFIGIEIYPLRLADAENRVSLCDGHGCDLRVGRCSRCKRREQGNEHNQHHDETDKPFLHVFAPPNRPFPGRNFTEFFPARDRLSDGLRADPNINVKLDPRSFQRVGFDGLTLLRQRWLSCC